MAIIGLSVVFNVLARSPEARTVSARTSAVEG